MLLLLQVRDITTDKEWCEAYHLVIPVLTLADADGGNEVSCWEAGASSM